jgi:hypothetical protein
VVRPPGLVVQRLDAFLSLVVIGARAATSFAQVFTPATWVRVLTAALGALVAITEGWQRITRYGETWIAYRVPRSA